LALSSGKTSPSSDINFFMLFLYLFDKYSY